MAKKVTPVDDEQVEVDDELDVEEGEGEEEGEEVKPKPKPKSDAKAAKDTKAAKGNTAKPSTAKPSASKGGKAKASAEPEEDDEESEDEEEEEGDGSSSSGFTAEEYEEFQELKKKLGGLDLDKIKKSMSEAEREKARLNAQRRAAERRAKDAEAEKASVEEEMRTKVEDLENKWAAAEKRAADKELSGVVDAYCRGLSFVGATPDLQRAAGSNFADIAKRALKAEHDEDGEIVVSGAKDGKPAKDILKALVEKHAYLIARKGKPGPVNPGGGIPPAASDDSENATEAAIAALRARRSRR